MPTPSLHISGEKIAFVGIGGGSDCIQAAILALLSGKAACVISIRAEKISLQDTTMANGENRSVLNHGGELAKGVFRIHAHTTGSGRFLESIPAEKLPVYLVVDYKDGSLSAQIETALKDFGADSVVAVDTGGDSLYRTQVDDKAKATPDQDIASLTALCLLKNYALFSCVVAKGIDSPDYADAVLTQARARVIYFSAAERLRILGLYGEFEMDGSHLERYGKTAFAWQAALRGETGMVRVPLPDSVVNCSINPWNPFVLITAEMAGCYLMDAQNHLDAIL
jgi:hypothetical protein